MKIPWLKKSGIIYAVVLGILVCALVFAGGCIDIVTLFTGGQGKGSYPNVTDTENCTNNTCICKPRIAPGQDGGGSPVYQVPGSGNGINDGELEIYHHYLCDPVKPGFNKLELEGSTSIPFTVNSKVSPPSVTGEGEIKYTASGQGVSCIMKKCSGLSILSLTGVWEYTTSTEGRECHFRISETTGPSDCKNLCQVGGEGLLLYPIHQACLQVK